MKIVYYYDTGKRSLVLRDATVKGLRRLGYRNVEVLPQFAYEIPEHDVAIYYGLSNKLIRVMRDYAADKNRIGILYDLGYWGRHDGGRLSGFHRIAINGLHGVPFMDDVTTNSARFNYFNLSLNSYKGTGSHILICGQSAKAAGVYGLKPEEWEKETIAKVRQVTDREIWYYPKKSWPDRRPIEGTVYFEGDLHLILKKSKVVLAHHSNSCLHSLEAGKPIHLHDGIAKEFSNPISEIENPVFPDIEKRDTFLAKVAYCQWKVSEITDGTMFRFFKEYGVLV